MNKCQGCGKETSESGCFPNIDVEGIGWMHYMCEIKRLNGLLNELAPDREKKLEDERGNIIATNVWKWLQRKRAYHYVPWVLNPKHGKFNAVKKAQQDERDKLLSELEQIIETTVKTMAIEEREG